MTMHVSHPLISVYIPTHNRQLLLQRAVQSVQAQDYPHLEILIVDDGSTDGTEAAVNEWMRGDGRIRYFRHASAMGAPTARNLAITSAKGEFITGLDDDDWFDQQRLSQFWTAWQAHPSGNAAHPVFLYGADITLTSAGTHAHHKPVRVQARDLCQSNCVGNQIFAPRATWLASGGFDTSLHAWQDLDMWIRMLGPNGHGQLVPTALQHIDAGHASPRISGLAKTRLAQSRNQVVSSAAHLGSKAQFLLYCQMYSEYYGHVPDWGDVLYAMRAWPSTQHLLHLLSLRRKRLRQQRQQTTPTIA